MNTSIPQDLPPQLSPRSFDGMLTQLTDLGLRHEEFITEEIREYECYPVTDSDEKRLRSIASKRGDSFICLNPSNYSATDLINYFTAAEDADKSDSTFRLGDGFKQPYDQSWRRRIFDDGEEKEGQELTLVIFDGDKPVGFQGFEICINRNDSDDSKVVFLTIKLNLVHVIKNQRKKGYGLDLGIGCGHITNNIISALLKVVPDHTSLDVMVETELETFEGEMVAETVFDVIEGDIDNQMEECNRSTVTLSVVFEGGF
jgi:hypothetical protein